jgi:MFS-type transporter involved in bile tolerance (Atg22 family)
LSRFVLHDGESYVFAFAATAYFLCSLPLLFQKPPSASPAGKGSGHDRSVSRRTQVWFLLGVLLVTAGLHGTALNMVAYLGETRGLPGSRAQELWVLGVLAVIAGAGCVGLFGKLVEKYPYTWLMGSILVWCLAVGGLAFPLELPLLVVVVALAGFASGSILGGLRGEFAAITSAERQGTSFGTYFLFQRIGQGIGPLFWILTGSRSTLNEAAISLSPVSMSALGLGGIVMFGLAKRSDRGR